MEPDLLERMLTTPAGSRLEELVAEQRGISGRDVPTRTLEGDMSGLRHLDLVRCSAQWDSISLPRLETLCLTEISRGPTVRQLVSLLQRSPGLRDLKLGWNRSLSPVPDFHPERAIDQDPCVHLSCLERLTIDTLSPTYAEKLLASIRFPQVSRIEITLEIDHLHQLLNASTAHILGSLRSIFHRVCRTESTPTFSISTSRLVVLARCPDDNGPYARIRLMRLENGFPASSKDPLLLQLLDSAPRLKICLRPSQMASEDAMAFLAGRKNVTKLHIARDIEDHHVENLMDALGTKYVVDTKLDESGSGTKWLLPNLEHLKIEGVTSLGVADVLTMLRRRYGPNEEGSRPVNLVNLDIDSIANPDVAREVRGLPQDALGLDCQFR